MPGHLTRCVSLRSVGAEGIWMWHVTTVVGQGQEVVWGESRGNGCGVAEAGGWCLRAGVVVGVDVPSGDLFAVLVTDRGITHINYKQKRIKIK